MHPALLALRAALQADVPGPLGDEDDRAARPGPSRAAPPLDRPDHVRDRLVEDHEVGRGNVEPFLRDRRRDQAVDLPGAELVEQARPAPSGSCHVDAVSGGLTDEAGRPDTPVARRLNSCSRSSAVCRYWVKTMTRESGEAVSWSVTIVERRLDLGMFERHPPKHLAGLDHLRIAEERPLRGGRALGALPVQEGPERIDALGLDELEGVRRLHRRGLGGHRGPEVRRGRLAPGPGRGDLVVQAIPDVKELALADDPAGRRWR